VAGDPERHWNEALQTVNRIKGEIADIMARRRNGKTLLWLNDQTIEFLLHVRNSLSGRF
jgi:hypothetical protein